MANTTNRSSKMKTENLKQGDHKDLENGSLRGVRLKAGLLSAVDSRENGKR